MILPSVKQKTIIYHKKQKPNTAKTKSEMPQKTKLPKGVECGVVISALGNNQINLGFLSFFCNFAPKKDYL
jgi:hypothetical protein